jgi:octaprenyl-diphosphate synthase
MMTALTAASATMTATLPAAAGAAVSSPASAAAPTSPPCPPGSLSGDFRALADLVAADLTAVEEVFDAELATDVPSVRGLVAHIGGFRGKMLRPTLLLLTAKALGGVNRHHHTLGAVVEMVHVSTLVHDDVLDESRVRRGRSTVNQRWGNETAVLLGDFLISHAYHLCSLVGDAEAARLVGAATNTVCEGELLQVSHRGDWDLTEAEYEDIVARKTGELTAVSCLLGAKYAGASPRQAAAMARYGRALGVAFQIADDVLDLFGEEAEAGKSLGTDLVKGKATLPMIHLLAHLGRGPGGEARRAETVARLREDPTAALPDIRRRLASAGSLDYALSVAESRIRQAVDCLCELPPGPARDALARAAEMSIRRRR